VQIPCGSAAAAGLGLHAPSDEASAQLWQAPWQASAQQTPSTQKLLAHWLAAEQVCPLALGPQLPATQVWPLTQSLSEVHCNTQASFSHLYGLQAWTPCGRQVPRPSQLPAVFSRLPLHAGARQTVSAANFAQPPMPSHRPVCPQVAAAVAWQVRCGSAVPAAIGQQVPSRPLWLQLTHAPAQATLQQNPSAQNPEAHWEADMQTAPMGLGPQLPATHLTPPAQSASEVQLTKHALVWLLQP